jgi:hypothetical protein
MLGKSITLDGAESVQDVYRERTRVGQSVFYTDDEKLAVSDDMIVSTSPAYQQTPGAILAAEGVPVDAEATYLVKIAEHMIWPYDDEGRLIGEGCLGIRRVGPRVHAVRPDRCPHRGAIRQVARATHQATSDPQPVHCVTEGGAAGPYLTSISVPSGS